NDAQIADALRHRTDTILVLPSIARPTCAAALVRQSGDMIVETCRRLGMIADPDVPVRDGPSDRVARMLGHLVSRPQLT
ncbi:MAG: hypothetical protein AAF264_04925, partial [Pseudomonadota bacterium]